MLVSSQSAPSRRRIAHGVEDVGGMQSYTRAKRDEGGLRISMDGDCARDLNCTILPVTRTSVSKASSSDV